MDEKNSVPCYSQKLDEALSLVSSEFRYKVRKVSGIPYLSHLLQVMVTVAENNGDEEQLIAALLHDFLEDIEGASASRLAEQFGEPVVELVLALSDATDARNKAPWKVRKDAYLDHLTSASPRVKLISVADKLHNARSICHDLVAFEAATDRSVDEVWERFKPSKEESLWYYRAVVRALGNDWNHLLLEDLRAEVKRMHQLSGQGT